MTRPCILILGGSFDPAHNGHVALANCFIDLLGPDELRIIPAGNPWQKSGLQASAGQRMDMLRLAFQRQTVPTVIDDREIRRSQPSYTIDTLRAIRAECGAAASIVFLLGADQLQRLHTWRKWENLFDYAHLCAAARPGFAIDDHHVPAAVAHEFRQRAAAPAQIRENAHGLTCLAADLAVDVSATQIRSAMKHARNRESLKPLLPGAVLDYIEQHQLYQA